MVWPLLMKDYRNLPGVFGEKTGEGPEGQKTEAKEEGEKEQEKLVANDGYRVYCARETTGGK